MQNQNTPPQEAPESGENNGNLLGAFKAAAATVRGKVHGLFRSEEKFEAAALAFRAEFIQERAFVGDSRDTAPAGDDAFSSIMAEVGEKEAIRAKWHETLAEASDPATAEQGRDVALNDIPKDIGAVAWNAWEEGPIWREGPTEEAAYSQARQDCESVVDRELWDEAEYAKLRGVYGLQEDHHYYIAQEDPAGFAPIREEIVSRYADSINTAPLKDIPSLNEKDFGEFAAAFKANSHQVSEKVGDFVVSEIACRAAREREANREQSEPSRAREPDIER